MSDPKEDDKTKGVSIPQEQLDELVGLPFDEAMKRIREHERALLKSEGETN